MVFSKDNRLSMVIDYSEMMNFKNGKLITSGEECDTTFDGKKITAKSQDQDVLVLERRVMLTAQIWTASIYSYRRCYIRHDGCNRHEDLLHYYRRKACNGNGYVNKYAADGKYITVLGDEIGMFSSEDGDDVTSEYKIDGETLTIFSDDEEEVFIRTKE